MQALNPNYAEGSNCQNFYNVSTKVSYTQNYSNIVAYINSLDIVNNVSDIVFASNMIQQAVQSPMRKNSQDQICTLDIHCNFHGTCSGASGLNRCLCDQGFFGTYCDFSGTQLQDLRDIVDSMVGTVLGTMQQRYELTPFDLEVIGNLVRGVTSKPDLVDDETFVSVITLLEFVGNSSVYANKPLTTNVTKIVLEAFSNAMAKMSHSYKVRRADPDAQLLGMGLSL